MLPVKLLHLSRSVVHHEVSKLCSKSLWNTYLSIRRYDLMKSKPDSETLDRFESIKGESENFEIISDIPIHREVPKSYEEFIKRKRLAVNHPDKPKLLRVAIIGSPNVGKSTLTNIFTGFSVSSVSPKVHTTRHRVIGIYVEEDTQIEFLDTPGLITAKHRAKHKLEPTFMSHPPESARLVDIIAVLVDSSNIRERRKLNPGIIQILKKYPDKESILILNKIDLIKAKRNLLQLTNTLTCGVVNDVISHEPTKRTKITQLEDPEKKMEKLFKKTEELLKLQECTDNLDETNLFENPDIKENEASEIGWPHFSRVFYISALTTDGVEDIRNYFLERAMERPWLHHSSSVTDQNPEEIVKSVVRSKCLAVFKYEIPYNLNFKIELWDVDKSGLLQIAVVVFAPEKNVKIIIGPKGKNIAKIVGEAQQEIANIFHCDVKFNLIVKGYKEREAKV